jgi:hypothetical protein
VFAEPLKAAEGLGVTAALAVTAIRETKVIVRRQNVTSFLPRTLQRCVRTRVLLRGSITFLGCSLKSRSPTAKFELQIQDSLLSFFTILLILCYSRRLCRTQRGEAWPPIASILAAQGLECRRAPNLAAESNEVTCTKERSRAPCRAHRTRLSNAERGKLAFLVTVDENVGNFCPKR